MKRVLIMLISLTFLLSGCRTQKPLYVNKYEGYKCYDYHLACLDAYEQKGKTTVEVDDLKYTVWYRKPVSESDEQFICASVKQLHPLSSAETVIMQNPDDHIDVLTDWTIKNIELYYIDLRNYKPLWNEDEPVRTPASIINTNTDAAVFVELINFITNEEYSEKYILDEGFEREIPNDDYVMYLRVHFNESKSIIWDSEVRSYISHQTMAREISIDKGRLPEGIAAPNSLMVSIEAFPLLFEWISETITNLN